MGQVLATSNVIELKPDKRYLLIFKGERISGEVSGIMDMLHDLGVRGVGIILQPGQDVQVIEAPATEE